MASGITTAQQLIDVLDAIYNNVTQYDHYVSADGTMQGSLRLYYNEISRTATIFKRVDEDTEYVVCTFNPESVFTSQQETYLCKVMKNVVANTETLANDVALGAYVDLKTLLRNICASLGVNLASNFDELNPQLYEDMVNIIKKWYGDELQNKAPYAIARKDVENVATYRSYIPKMIIVDIAIYLNSLGIFVVGGDKMYNAGISQLFGFTMGSQVLGANFTHNNLISNTNIRDYIPSVGDVYGLYDKSFIFSSADFIRNNISGNWLTWFNILLPAIKGEYYGELDSSQVLILTQIGNILRIYQIPATCTFTSYYAPGTSYLSITNVKENYVINVYKATYNTTTQEITFNKSIIEKLRYETYGSGSDTPLNSYEYTISNIKFNNLKLYSGERFRQNSSQTWKYYVDYYPELQNSTKYDDIKFLPYKYFIQTSSGAGQIPYKYMIIQRNSNIFNDNDFILISSDNDVYRFYVFKNVQHLSSDIMKTLCNASMRSQYFAYNKELVNNVITDRNLSYARHEAVSSPSLKNHYFDFYEDVNYYIYECRQNTTDYLLTQTASGTTNKYTFTVGTEGVTDSIVFENFNLGEAVLVEDEVGFEGITLQEGATYPNAVIDIQSFDTTYPDWQAIGYSQPYFEDEVITNTYNAQWFTMTVDKTPPLQQDAQEGQIDTTEVDDVISDIDDAEEGNDSTEIDPNDNKIDGDEGDTPSEDNIADLPSAVAGGFLKIYMLTASELETFATNLIKPDFWTSLNMFLSDPMDAIISLQAGYLFQPQGAVSEQIVFNGYTFSNCTGSRLATNYFNYNLGTIDISEKFNTYQDIVNSQLEIFLPYIGYVNLEISDYIGGSISLKARIDNLTGTILYSIYSVRNGATQLTHQISGNCQVQLPIKSEDNSNLFMALMRGNKIGG